MKGSFILLVVLATVVGSVLACNLPAPETPGPAATSPPDSTAAPNASGVSAGRTEAPSPTEPPPQPNVVTYAADVFNLYDLEGTLLGGWPGPGLGWARVGKAQVAGNAVYYVDAGETGLGGVVRRVTEEGSQELSHTAAPELNELAFAVTEAADRIAWSHSGWDGTTNVSQLWSSALNGSATQVVAQSNPNDAIEEWFILEPYRWTRNGELLFSWQVTGIGGYILFFGYSSMYRYDPATGEVSPLVPVGPTSSPCWSTVSPDTAYIAGTCTSDTGVVGMRERNLATGAETIMPSWPEDTGQAGGAAYSPSGSRLGYAVARGDPVNEAGQVILVESRGGEPRAIASMASGYFQDIQWVDEERMVVGLWEGEAARVGLLTMGGTLTAVGEGMLVGLMWP